MIPVRICHVVVSLIVHDDHYGRYHDIDADDQHGMAMTSGAKL